MAWGKIYLKCDDLEKENRKLKSEVVSLMLGTELARSQVKGITTDRDELQAEHEALMASFDKLKSKNKMCSAVLGDVQRALNGGIR